MENHKLEAIGNAVHMMVLTPHKKINQPKSIIKAARKIADKIIKKHGI